MYTNFTNRLLAVLKLPCSAVLAPVLCLAAFAQDYSVNWYTTDAGGGTSTGGVYSVSGTIGQPDAGPIVRGGDFSVQGGFRAFHVLQTPGAPFLTIVPTGLDQATISWTPATPGWVLQETLSLSPGGWSNSPSDFTNPIVVRTNLPSKYNRLNKPRARVRSTSQA